jgi:hypothetical protein
MVSQLMERLAKCSNAYSLNWYNIKGNGSNVSQNAKEKFTPDEARTFEKGKIELANFDDITIGRAVLESGWSWEKSVKPIVKTNSCQQSHTLYTVSGRMKIVMDDGIEDEIGPGDTSIIPSGHNAWVVGNERYVSIDFTGLMDYAKKK